jgi:hypothetical protein
MVRLRALVHATHAPHAPHAAAPARTRATSALWITNIGLPQNPSGMQRAKLMAMPRSNPRLTQTESHPGAFSRSTVQKRSMLTGN